MYSQRVSESTPPARCGTQRTHSERTGTDMRSHYCGGINESHIDQEVTLCGWVHRRRDHGGVIFLDLRDRDGMSQVVVDPDRSEEHTSELQSRPHLVCRLLLEKKKKK